MRLTVAGREQLGKTEQTGLRMADQPSRNRGDKTGEAAFGLEAIPEFRCGEGFGGPWQYTAGEIDSAARLIGQGQVARRMARSGSAWVVTGCVTTGPKAPSRAKAKRALVPPMSARSAVSVTPGPRIWPRDVHSAPAHYSRSAGVCQRVTGKARKRDDCCDGVRLLPMSAAFSALFLGCEGRKS